MAPLGPHIPQRVLSCGGTCDASFMAPLGTHMSMSFVVTWMIWSDLAALMRCLSMPFSLKPTLADDSQVTVLSATCTMTLTIPASAVLMQNHSLVTSVWPLGTFASADLLCQFCLCAVR